MQCPDCGAYFSEGDEFCGECGRRLSSEATGGDSIDAAPPAAAASGAITPPVGTPVVVAPKPAPAKAQPQRRNLLPIVIVGAVASLLFLLCAAGAIIWVVTRDEPAAVPPTPIVSEMGALLYEEDFDDPGSGWSAFVDEDTSAGYEDGGYRVAVYQSNYMAWGNPDPALDLADLSIKVDVRQVEGPLDNNFGVFVRYVEDNEQVSYYWFQISGDGFYSVDLHWNGEWVSLVSWEPSTDINTGLGATNQIWVVCSGSLFSFYVNDAHLVDVVDGTIGRGSIGLAAGTFEEPGVVVQFDNLRVYELVE